MGASPIPGPIELQAFNANGALVDSDTVSSTTFSQLEVASQQGIQSVTISSPSTWVVLDNLSITEAVPEPSTWAMLAMGGAGLVLARRRVKLPQ